MQIQVCETCKPMVMVLHYCRQSNVQCCTQNTDGGLQGESAHILRLDGREEDCPVLFDLKMTFEDMSPPSWQTSITNKVGDACSPLLQQHRSHNAGIMVSKMLMNLRTTSAYAKPTTILLCSE